MCIAPGGNFFSEGMVKGPSAPSHCSSPGLQCAGAKSEHRDMENVHFCGGWGEVKVTNKSDAENAITTAKRKEPLKRSLLLYTGTIGTGALRATPLPPKAPSGGDVHSFERREPKLRIQLKRLPASGSQAASLAGP